MKIKDLTFPQQTFEEFMEANDLTVVLEELSQRGCDQVHRYSATIKDYGIRGNSGASKEIYQMRVGYGDSKTRAIFDFASQLRGQVLASIDDPHSPDIRVPNEWKPE